MDSTAHSSRTASLAQLAQQVSSWGQTDWADGAWHRTHPINLCKEFIDAIRGSFSLLLTLVAIPMIADLPSYTLGIAVGLWFAVVLINACIAWLTRYYKLDQEQLSVRGGVFKKYEDSISIGHIHALNATERPYMRPFGVMSITISAAGVDADIALHAVPFTLYKALELMRIEQQTQQSGQNQQSTSDEQASLDTVQQAVGSSPYPGLRSSRHGRRVFVASMRDIVLFAITNMSIVAALIVLYGFIDNIEHIVPSHWASQASHTIETTVMHNAVTIALAVLGLIIIVGFCSIIMAVLRWYNFEVWRDGDNITLVKGALTRATSTVSVKRIQAVAIEQSLMRRLFHLCTVRVVMGSFDSQQETDQHSTRGTVVLIPVIQERRVDEILQCIIPEWQVHYQDRSDFKHTGRGLTRYYILAPLLWSIALLAAWVILTIVTWFEGDWHTLHDEVALVLAVAAIWPFMALWSLIRRYCASRTDGFALLEQQMICYRTFSGKFMTIVTRRSRIQSVRRKVPIWRVRASRIGSLQMPIALSQSDITLYWHALSLQDTDTLMKWAIHS